MNFESLAWILSGIFLLSAFTALIVLIKYEKLEQSAIKWGRNSVLGFLIIVYLISHSDCGNNYTLRYHVDEWVKYGLPLVDSTFYLRQFNHNKAEYFTWNKDSIRHNSKTVEYNLSFLYKISDEFINLKENKELEMIFIKSTWIRKEKRLYLFKQLIPENQNPIDTIDIEQKDSILHSWGLQDKLSKPNEYIF